MNTPNHTEEYHNHKTEYHHTADRYHNHGHRHHHHHHDHTVNTEHLNKAFIFGIILNALFVVIEFIVGFLSNSVGLISDAGHNLSDVASLILAMLAFRLAKIHPTKKYTYGYKKMTIHVSLINAVILLVAVALIIIESVNKLINVTQVEGNMITVTAAIGVVINALTAYLFIKDKDKDLNIKGAYLHMAADALVSVGVVVSGILITVTGWYRIDAIIGLIVAVIIIYSTVSLLHNSVRLVLDGVPDNINIKEIEEGIRTIEGVEDIHHIHIWAISTTENSLTAHVKINDIKNLESIKHAIKHFLSNSDIIHSTIEFEDSTENCPEKTCDCGTVK